MACCSVADVLMQERINPIIVNDEVTDLNASIMSQEIECSKVSYELICS